MVSQFFQTSLINLLVGSIQKTLPECIGTACQNDSVHLLNEAKCQIFDLW